MADNGIRSSIGGECYCDWLRSSEGEEVGGVGPEGEGRPVGGGTGDDYRLVWGDVVP